MVQTGPGNPADCVICSLPGFEQIGTATSHSQHPTTSRDEFAVGIGPNSGAKHGGPSDCLRQPLLVNSAQRQPSTTAQQ